MDEAGSNLITALDQQRRQYISEFLQSNEDLAERMHAESVSTVLDTEEDVLSLGIGIVREGVSFTSDGELYLRTDPATHKLISAELHHFTDNSRQSRLPFRLMLELLQMAGSVQLTVLPPSGAEPMFELGRDMRELVET